MKRKDLSRDELQVMMKEFDHQHNGSIQFLGLLEMMSPRRRRIRQRYLNEWDNITADDTLCLTHWLKKKYPGDAIYDLLDAFYYFSINNNCCYRHKDEFPYWDDCTKTSCIDKEERLELEDWYNEIWEFDY